MRLQRSAQRTVARRLPSRWLGPSAAVPSSQFKSGSPPHVEENAVALSLTLTRQELETLDAAHPVRSVDVLRSLLDRGKRWLRSFRNDL